MCKVISKGNHPTLSGGKEEVVFVEILESSGNTDNHREFCLSVLNLDREVTAQDVADFKAAAEANSIRRIRNLWAK